MAYDECLADRVRMALRDLGEFETKKMFGGLAFLLGGNMCCGIIEDKVVLRLGNEGAETALEDEVISEMDFTGKPIRSMVYLAGDVEGEVLEECLAEAVSFTETLPEK